MVCLSYGESDVRIGENVLLPAVASREYSMYTTLFVVKLVLGGHLDTV
jgi:hypothetical protein